MVSVAEETVFVYFKEFGDLVIIPSDTTLTGDNTAAQNACLNRLWDQSGRKGRNAGKQDWVEYVGKIFSHTKDACRTLLGTQERGAVSMQGLHMSQLKSHLCLPLSAAGPG